MGNALSEVFESEHYNDTGRTAHYVEVRWTDVVDPDDRIPTEELRARVPGVPWNHLQGSGVQVDPESAGHLRRIWRQARAGG